MRHYLVFPGLSLRIAQPPCAPATRCNQRNGDTVSSAVRSAARMRAAAAAPRRPNSSPPSAPATVAPWARRRACPPCPQMAVGMRGEPPELGVDPLPAASRHQQDGGTPRLAWCDRAHAQRTFEIAAARARRSAPVGFGHERDVGHLDDAGLEELQAVAGAGLHREHHRVDEVATSVSDWPTPTVSISTTSRQARISTMAAAQRSASPPSRSRAAMERTKTPLVARVDVDPGAVAKSAPRVRRRDGSTAMTPTVRPSLPPRANQGRHQVDLPTPGGPVRPDTSRAVKSRRRPEDARRRPRQAGHLDRCQRARQRCLAAVAQLGK